ncbi:MFS transporter [Sciscionella marina]|uniref:MFS transporter n=1 Tax=Sciscionella marina TaxID=508770 RepID=UPI000476A840|nr:MFS transporter [Sciscionella marina]
MSARTSVTVAFALNGGFYASWATRIPELSEQVGAGPGVLGLALLGTAAGMALGANPAGRLCARFGARSAVLVSAVLLFVLVPMVGLASSVAVLAVLLLLFGFLIATLDVGMNVGAMHVVRRLDRPLMPVFHAWFSFGGLAGSLGAGAASGLGLPVVWHLLLVSVIGAVLLGVLGREVPDDRPAGHARPAGGVAPMRRPVLWVLGLVVVCSGLAEGASTDWSAMFLVHERGVSTASAAVAFAVFSVAMAVSRLAGERLERRFGPYRLLIGASSIAALGLVVMVLVPLAWVGYLGFGLAGAGLAFCFPVALSLAGSSGSGSGEREIGFVSGIAYTGYMAGPPAMGGIASATDYSVSFGVVALIVAVIPAAAKGASVLRARAKVASPVG